MMEEGMEENIIYVQDEDGEEIALYVLEETKFAGVNYLLVTDASEEEDGECYVLKDGSSHSDQEAVYTFVEDDAELENMFQIFSELIDDTNTELTF
jgi:hypothetical protein